MIADLKPYPGMKDSGVSWLERVPSHWLTPRLKNVFYEVDRRSGTGEGTLLSLRMQDGLVDHHRMGGKPIPSSGLVHYKRTEPGEIVMNRMRAVAGLFAATRTVGLVSPDYAVLRPRSHVELQYFVLLFRTPVMMSAFRLEARGLGTGESGFLRLYTERFGMLAAPMPPMEEQVAIVRYLDYADRRIRRYIRAKQKLIKLLEEQKQVVIHRAVTRGLDRGVQLRTAGAEWLDDLPQHWEIVPNRAVLRLEKHPVGSAWANYVLLSLTKRGIVPRDMENPEGKFPASFDTYQEVNPGDLVFCLFDIDETPRAVGLSGLRGMVTGAYTRFTCDPSVVDWVYLFYLAMDNGKRLKPLYTGLRKVISKSSFLSARIPLPPAAERAAILTHVEASTSTVDRAIDHAQREITLLREYRTRLIADVVTGKLDVRKAAARLPDEPDDVEPTDELDAVTDGDEDDATDEAPENADA